MQPTERAAHLPPPLRRQDPPFILAGHAPIRRREAPRLEEDADGCGCLLAVILIGAAVCLAAILGSGCTSRYTVIPADREAIPVKQIQSNPNVYQEASSDATGWYLSDAVLLDLLEAD